jgi:hypothetical protein
MSTFLAWTIVGFAAIIVACFAHDESGTTMARSKFVFLSLISVGSLPIGYVAFWALANQHPSFSLTFTFQLGVCLWVTAAAYSFVCTLAQRDIAPSN